MASSRIPPRSSVPSRPPYSEAGSSPEGVPIMRYGRVGVVPWSFSDTLRGLTLTLVPWFVFIAYSQIAAAHADTTTLKVLTRGQDVEQGISVLVLTALIEGVFLIAPLYFTLGRRENGASRAEALDALGFRAVPLRGAILLVGGGFAAVLAVTFLYTFVVEQFKLGLQTNVDGLLNELHVEPVTVLCTLFGAVFVAPICEETFFRGFAFAGLLRGMNVVLAGLVSAVLFTAAHGDLGSAAPLFVLGLLLANLRWRTGSIWPSIALHMLNNLFAAVFVIVALVHP